MEARPRLHALRLPGGAWRFPRGLWLADRPDLGDQLEALLGDASGDLQDRGAIEFELSCGRYRVTRDGGREPPRVSTLGGSSWPADAPAGPLRLLPRDLTSRRAERELLARSRALQGRLQRIERQLEHVRARLLRSEGADTEPSSSLAGRLREARLGLAAARRATVGSLELARQTQTVLRSVTRELRDPEALRDVQPLLRALREQAQGLDAAAGQDDAAAGERIGSVAIPVAALAGTGVLCAGIVSVQPALALLGAAALAPAAWSAIRTWRLRRAAPAIAARERARLQDRAFELLREARVLPPDGPISGDHLRAAASRLEARERTATVRDALRALLPSRHEQRRTELRLELLTTEALPPDLGTSFEREPLLQVGRLLSALADDLDARTPAEPLLRSIERLERRREACRRARRMLSKAAARLLQDHVGAGHEWPLFLSAATVVQSPHLQRALQAGQGRLRCPVIIEPSGPGALRDLLEALPRELAFHLRPLPAARVRRRARAAAARSGR